MGQLNKNGFSLIQVLIAVGLMSVISLGIADLMVSSNNVSKSMNTKMERLIYYTEVSNTLLTEANCSAAINNHPFNLSDVNDVNGMNFSLDLPGFGVVSAGRAVPNTNLEVESLVMSNARLEGTGPSGENIYRVDIDSRVKAKTDIVGGSSMKPSPLPGIFVTVAGGVITSCNSEIGVSYMCGKMNGTYDPSTNNCTVKPTAKDVCDIIAGNYNPRTDECSVATAPTNQSCGSYKHGETWRSCTGGGCGGRVGKYTYYDNTCINGTVARAVYRSGRNSASCFTAETKVIMDDGSLKEISKVEIGDRVIGENGQINNVIGIEVPKLGTRYLFSLNGGPFFVTAEHPFKTLRGWTSFDPSMTDHENPNLVSRRPMDIGDTLLRFDDEIEYLEDYQLKTDNKEKRVYNLLLDGNNTYYANGYLVHNKP